MSLESSHLNPDPSLNKKNATTTYSHNTAYMAVAAAEMIIELTITAKVDLTRMNAKVDKAVATVQIARERRLPSLV
jgi:hypothetical protein